MFDFLKSGSAKIQAEIDAESKRAEEAAAADARLREARGDALLADDTKELDRIDAQLVASSRDAGRRAERVKLLEGKLAQAQEREKAQEIDAIVARAEKARKLGEELIRKDYAKQAAALAETLMKLRAIDKFIEEQNYTLANAGREGSVPSPNQIRHILGRTGTRTIRKMVGINEAEHPHNAEWRKTEYRGGPYMGNPPANVTLHNGQSVPRFMEVEVKEDYYHPPTWAAALHKEIQILPSASNDQIPLYNADARGLGEKLAKLQKDLDL
ncbi:hypothetical protein [Tahibacter harae]|uniref:Minor structural protein GP20 n=1 Tax=Tahibacter harae TaxID=2963937 RepID=A0ABT1QR15_9GAMM|nr:hypothetical protein [Tahibacter harae]MCQ4164702.1 hypothetical protein [Tahibacter harae]